MSISILTAQRDRVRQGLSLGQLWPYVAVALPVAATLRAPLPTNDLAYAVRAGDLMLGSHSLIRTDPLSFTAGGHAWLDQQWGSHLLYELHLPSGGWSMVALARAVLVGLTFLLVFAACRLVGADRRHAAMATLVSFLIPAMWPISYAPRAQLFGVVLFALTLWLLAGRRQHPPRIWWLVPIVGVWANLHGSFFLGPLLLALAGIEDLAQRSPHWRQTFCVAGLAVVATVLNPFGIMVWRYLVALSTNPIVQKCSAEWQRPTIHDPIGIAFFVSIAAIALLCARKPRVPGPPC